MSQENLNAAWPLWEVFVRSSRGLSHVHAGSLHAPDDTMALRNARDLYTQRTEGPSVWVVPSESNASSDPDSKGGFFESPQGKSFRHATYYTKSEGVKHLCVLQQVTPRPSSRPVMPSLPKTSLQPGKKLPKMSPPTRCILATTH